jgi:hypothetical protein
MQDWLNAIPQSLRLVQQIQGYGSSVCFLTFRCSRLIQEEICKIKDDQELTREEISSHFGKNCLQVIDVTNIKITKYLLAEDVHANNCLQHAKTLKPILQELISTVSRLPIESWQHDLEQLITNLKKKGTNKEPKNFESPIQGKSHPLEPPLGDFSIFLEPLVAILKQFRSKFVSELHLERQFTGAVHENMVESILTPSRHPKTSNQPRSDTDNDYKHDRTDSVCNVSLLFQETKKKQVNLTTVPEDRDDRFKIFKSMVAMGDNYKVITFGVILEGKYWSAFSYNHYTKEIADIAFRLNLSEEADEVKYLLAWKHIRDTLLSQKQVLIQRGLQIPHSDQATRPQPKSILENSTSESEREDDKAALQVLSYQKLSESHNVWKVELQCENGKKFHNEYGPYLILKQQNTVDFSVSIPLEVQLLKKYNAETLPVLHWQWGHKRKYYEILLPLLPQHSPHSIVCLEKYVVSVIKELNRIHSLGIIHRDIKPSNICYNSFSQTATIIDFGLSTTIEQNTSTGTRFYMSPDVVLTTKSDIWCFGKSILELLMNLYPKIDDALLSPIDDCRHNPPLQSQVDDILIRIKSQIPEALKLLDLISAMLKVDASNRISSGELVNMVITFQYFATKEPLNAFIKSDNTKKKKKPSKKIELKTEVVDKENANIQPTATQVSISIGKSKKAFGE